MSLKLSSKFYMGVLLCFFGMSLSAMAADFRIGENVSVSGEFSDNLFVTGGDVQVEVHSKDDAYVAGGEVDFTKTIVRHLFLAGGDLSFRDSKAEVSTIAGGKIDLSHSTFNELIVAGGDIHLTAINVEDDLVVAGGEIFIGRESIVKDSSVIAGGEVTLEGKFEGDVRVIANELKVSPTVVIKGDLYYTAKKIDISTEAQISGNKIEKVYESKPEYDKGAWGAFSALLLFLGGLLVAPILVVFFPGPILKSSNFVRSQFLASLGQGTIAFFLIPIVVLVLLMSIIGTAVGLALIPGVFIIAIFSYGVAVFTVGDQLRLWLRKSVNTEFSGRKKLFQWTLLGSLVFSILSAIPLLGAIFYFILMLVGLGALMSHILKKA